MNVFIVYAHPEPTSFNGAMKDTAVEVLTAAGHAVQVSDLYAEEFDPVAGRHDFLEVADGKRWDYQVEQKHASETGTFAPDLAREQERLHWCDLLIFQFPLWWSGPPAILKGWIDRVVAFGALYDLGHRYATGKLQGRRGMVAMTTGGPESRFGPPDGEYKSLDVYLASLEFGCIEYLGMDLLPRFVAWSAGRVGDDGRKDFLDQWTQHLLSAVAEPPARAVSA